MAVVIGTFYIIFMLVVYSYLDSTKNPIRAWLSLFWPVFFAYLIFMLFVWTVETGIVPVVLGLFGFEYKPKFDPSKHLPPLKF